MEGYEYFDDRHLIHIATGELVPAYTDTIPIGSAVWTPEKQAAYRAWKEREARILSARAINKELGKFVFANAAHRYQDITPQNMARLIFLSTFTTYGDDTLRRRAPITKNTAQKLTQLSDTTFRRFWDEVVGKYLHEDDEGNIHISEDFKRGALPKKEPYVNYQKLYIDTVRKLYLSCPASKHKHLGRVFQLLPFINIEYNILCYAPEEKDIDKIEPMSVDEFCDITGVSSEQRSRVVRDYGAIKFPVDGHEERFCSFVFDGVNVNEARIFINPKIMYRGSDSCKVKVLGAFTSPASAA